MHMQAILNTAAFAWDVLVFRNLKAFLEPDCTVPWRQTRTVRLEKIYSEAAASLSVILSLAEKAAITTNAWKALITELCVTVTECDPAEPLDTREAHCGKHEFSFPKMYLKTKISVWMFNSMVLNKFRCREEARTQDKISYLKRVNRPTLKHFADCKLTWNIVDVHNPALWYL